MTSQVQWLPPLILLESYGGDWGAYFAEVYEGFRRDHVYHRPRFRGEELRLKRHPVIDGKEATFWHLISEGMGEADRLPDLRRCERILWPRQVIEHADDPVIKVWGNKRGTETRTLLWLEEEDYLVVLAERSGYKLLWTAYLVPQEHRKAKLRKEYESFLRGQKS